jgi:hypothetical protein
VTRTCDLRGHKRGPQGGLHRTLTLVFGPWRTLRAPRDFPQHAEVVARNGEILERPQRLRFQSTPSLAEEPSFNEKLEPLLQPLRERVDAAEEILRRKTAEAAEALSQRNDLERAAASIRNVTQTPASPATPQNPRHHLNCTDQEWRDYKDSLEAR